MIKFSSIYNILLWKYSKKKLEAFMPSPSKTSWPGQLAPSAEKLKLKKIPIDLITLLPISEKYFVPNIVRNW